MKTLDRDIYDFPKYYDLVYGSDWKAEFDFLQRVFKRHVGFKVRRLFEPACGTGRLIDRFARAGYRVGGNDLNPKAIDYCNARLKRTGSNDTASVQDMTDFELKRPSCSAFNTINSFRHLKDERQAVAHLDCMARAVKPGGVYVLGLHLSPLIGDTCDSERWSASRGHLTVNSSMWLVERNLKRRYEKFGMTFDVYTPGDQFQIRDEVRFRTYSARQIESLVAKVDSLQIDAIYDFGYDEEICLDDSVEDVVLVLKRK